MKFIIITLLLLFSLGSFADNQSCHNLSGEYSVKEPDFLNRLFVVRVDNDSCDKISVGSYHLKDGEVLDEVENSVLYVLQGSENLCDIQSCTYIENDNDHVKVLRSDRIDVGGKLCKYDHVLWRKNSDGNLEQIYSINDSSIRCRDFNEFAKTLFSVEPQSQNLIQTEQSLTVSDSNVLAEKIEQANGKTVTVSEEDPASILHTSSYMTSDGSLEIVCIRSLKNGNYVHAECSIKMDSALSQDDSVSTFQLGLIGDVKVARLFDMGDVQDLSAIVGPLNRYSSSQKVSVSINGGDRVLPKLQISCETDSSERMCQVSLFPESLVVGN